MKMNDWISKLDDFLKLSEKELLTHSGNVTAVTAAQKPKRSLKNTGHSGVKI